MRDSFLAPSLGACLVREVSRLGYYESLKLVFTPGGKVAVTCDKFNFLAVKCDACNFK